MPFWILDHGIFPKDIFGQLALLNKNDPNNEVIEGIDFNITLIKTGAGAGSVGEDDSGGATPPTPIGGGLEFAGRYRVKSATLTSNVTAAGSAQPILQQGDDVASLMEKLIFLTYSGCSKVGGVGADVSRAALELRQDNMLFLVCLEGENAVESSPTGSYSLTDDKLVLLLSNAAIRAAYPNGIALGIAGAKLVDNVLSDAVSGVPVPLSVATGSGGLEPVEGFDVDIKLIKVGEAGTIIPVAPLAPVDIPPIGPKDQLGCYQVSSARLVETIATETIATTDGYYTSTMKQGADIATLFRNLIFSGYEYCLSSSYQTDYEKAYLRLAYFSCIAGDEAKDELRAGSYQLAEGDAQLSMLLDNARLREMGWSHGAQGLGLTMTTSYKDV